jgi:hypothetical protein
MLSDPKSSSTYESSFPDLNWVVTGEPSSWGLTAFQRYLVYRIAWGTDRRSLAKELGVCTRTLRRYLQGIQVAELMEHGRSV